MSYAAERWARAQVAGNARAKAVLIELANCFNEGTGLCCPSAASIARVTELKAVTVFSAFDHLVRCGLIRKATSVGTSNRYILVGFNPDEWPAKKDDKPTPKTGHPRKRGRSLSRRLGVSPRRTGARGRRLPGRPLLRRGPGHGQGPGSEA